MKDYPRASLQGPHDLRIVIIPQFVQSAAIIAVDSKRTTDTHIITVVWTHHFPGKTSLAGLSWLVDVETTGLSLQCSAMFEGKKETWSGTFEDVHDKLQSTIHTHPSIDFVSCQKGAYSFFADLHVLNETELQVAVRFPASEWSETVNADIAKAIRLSGERVLRRPGHQAILWLIRDALLGEL